MKQKYNVKFNFQLDAYTAVTVTIQIIGKTVKKMKYEKKYEPRKE